MSDYTQAKRWLKVKTPFSDDALLLESFRGREAVSELFEFSLEMLALNETSVPFHELLGKPISVEMEQEEGPSRAFHGMVRELRRGSSGSVFTKYAAIVVPAVWKLTRRIQSRIFQNQTAPEILKTVLEGYDVDFKIRQRHFAHNYCVQYRESDFAFASRLMEEDGIYYYFVHAFDEGLQQTRHTLVIADDSILAPPVAGAAIRFDAVGGGIRPKARIHDWNLSQQLCVRRHELRGRHFESFTSPVTAQTATLASLAVGGSQLPLHVADDDMTVDDVASEVLHRFDCINGNGSTQHDRYADLYPALEQEAKRRAEEVSAAAVRIDGASACCHLTPGMRFAVAGHRLDDGEYLLTSLEHNAANASYRVEAEQPATEKYSNRFTCIPAALPYRPKRQTPAPRIDGVQTAIVVGPSGHEVYTDAYGRIKVCFQWDHEQKCDGSDTCWVRVASQWAGQGYGMISLPRIGQEVVVAFEDGDPDAPLIVGSVYNNNQATPFSLPTDLTKMCIKSKTVGGDSDQFHGVMFDDKQSNELLHIRSQKDAIVDCKNSHATYVPNQKTTRTGNAFVHIAGGLPLGIGSGSGGAPGTTDERAESGDSEVSVDDGSGFGGGDGGWAAETVFPDAAVPLYSQATAGLQIGTVLGGCVQTYLPLNASYVFDPIGLLASAGTQTGKWASALRCVSGAISGSVNVVYGAAFDLQYGPNYSFQRGGDVLQNEGPLSTAMKVFATLNALAISSSTLTGIMAGFLSDSAIKTYSLATAVATQATGVALLKAEQLAAKVDDAAARSKFGSEILAAYIANQVPDTLKDPVKKLAKDEATSALENAATEGKYAKHTVAGKYELLAAGIAIDLQAPKAGNQAPTLKIDAHAYDLIIQNDGTKPLGIMQAGKASVTLSDTAEKHVFIHAAGNNAIVLQVGADNNLDGAQVKLINNKIILQTAPGGVEADGASITLDGANITIAAGTNGTVAIKSNGDNGGTLTLSNDLAQLAAGKNADLLSINNAAGGLTLTSSQGVEVTAQTDANFTCANGTNFS